MRALVDTNVVVSGIFFGGPPAEIIRHWRRGAFDLVVSHEILREYRETVEELSHRYPIANAKEILETIELRSRLTFSIALPEPVCVDKDDDMFFAAALASKTKIIVSGDRHLLTRKRMKTCCPPS